MLRSKSFIFTDAWPDGPYATPMSVYGCPGSETSGWRTGYANMTFRQHLTENLDAVTAARHSSLLGPYSEKVVQLNFCYKLKRLASNTSLDNPMYDNSADNDSNSTLDNPVPDLPASAINSTPGNQVYNWPAGIYSIYRADQICPGGNTLRKHAHTIYKEF